MTPLLSIIIPTKNRYSYLKSCLRSLASQYNNPEVEIIITDNSTVKEDLTDVFCFFKNINYTYTDTPISQVENFESALEKVTGEYVTMIGDDDGLSGLLLEVVRYMKRNSISALNSPFITYYWPDIVNKNKINNFSGKMFIDSYDYSVVEVDAKKERQKCLEYGGTSLCNLPKMYYGIIRKDVLDAVKVRTGVYFPGPSPDMANAFSVSSFTGKFINFNAPLFIAGNSAMSAAGLGLAGKHVGEIKGHPQLPNDCYLSWTPTIPQYWSGPTIWAESVMHSIKRCKLIDSDSKFNYPRLYASCLVYNPEYKGKIDFAIKKYNHTHNRFWTYVQINFEKSKVWALRFRFLFKNVLKRFNFSKIVVHHNISDIEEASLILQSYDIKIKEMIFSVNQKLK
jgi:glycosyltransferase involved in cell wall biosynthesis